MTGIPREVLLIKRQTLIRFWPLASFVVTIYILVFYFLSSTITITAWLHSFSLLLLAVTMPFCIRYNKFSWRVMSLPGLG